MILFYSISKYSKVSYLVTRRAYISEISGGLFLSAKAYKSEVHAEGNMFQAPAIHLEFFWRKNGSPFLKNYAVRHKQRAQIHTP